VLAVNREAGRFIQLRAPKGVSLMSRLRVNAFGVSIDGYGAGSDQDLDNPMGVGGMVLHKWVFGTKTFQKMADFAGSLIGDEVGREGVDDDFAARGFENLHQGAERYESHGDLQGHEGVPPPDRAGGSSCHSPRLRIFPPAYRWQSRREKRQP
jgi:hypothetical protein